MPEIAFNQQAFLKKVRETIDLYQYCIVVVGEGLKDSRGQEVAADSDHLDSFGHAVLSGASEILSNIVTSNLDIKTRTVKLGYAQRAAAHFASATDVREAAECGAAAVREAVEGASGLMVKLVRVSDQPYRCSVAVQDLRDIANMEHMIPRGWIDEEGFLPNEKFLCYARPLIQGELDVPTLDGLPCYVSLEGVSVKKVLPSKDVPTSPNGRTSPRGALLTPYN